VSRAIQPSFACEGQRSSGSLKWRVSRSTCRAHIGASPVAGIWTKPLIGLPRRLVLGKELIGVLPNCHSDLAEAGRSLVYQSQSICSTRRRTVDFSGAAANST
jgi:hypothetical protein